MTGAEFIARLLKSSPPPDQRYGQWAYNQLAGFHPLLAEALRGTDADPFYETSRGQLVEFTLFVVQEWDNYERLGDNAFG